MILHGFLSAILKLALGIDFNAKIKPICLPRSMLMGDYDNKEGTIAGWGWDGQAFSDNLKEVETKIINTEVCDRVLHVRGADWVLQSK